MKKTLFIASCVTAMFACMPGRAQTPVTEPADQTIFPQRHTGIASLYIETTDGNDPTSKEDYSNCVIRLVENGQMTTYDINTNDDKTAGIRGRGNSTWGATKKPWRIKFTQKQKFLGDGYANAKSWTLLANAFDKSLMRNALTWHLGKAVGMEFCPAYKFVDLTMNGEYRGVYQISDQVQTAKDRVFLENTDTDWLLEYGNSIDKVDDPKVEFTAQGYYDADGNIISSKQTFGYVEIKNPEDELYTAVEEDIRAFVQDKLAPAIHPSCNSVHFQNPRVGYRSLIDPVSFINWYIATEITANWDGFYSVYMFRTPTGPLHFGPLWDYDLAYGNNSETYNSSYFPQNDFYSKLLCENNFDISIGENSYRRLQPAVNHFWSDPWFGAMVKMRFDELKEAGLEQTLLDAINEMSQELEEAGVENFNVWSDKDNAYTIEEYRKDWPGAVAKLKEFVSERIQVLDKLIAEKTADIAILTDDKPYTYDATKKHLMISRTFKAGMWNTICLPFKVSTTKIARWFGNGTKVSAFSKTTTGSDGTTTLEFTSHTGALEPGQPYLIMPTEENIPAEWGFDNMTFDNNNEAGTVSSNGITFCGTYAPTTLKTDGTQLFIGAGNKLLTPSSDTPIPAYRAYISLPVPVDKASKLYMSFDGVTSVDGIISAEQQTEQRIYNMKGQYVGNNLETLDKGLYIVNNKKVIKQ